MGAQQDLLTAAAETKAAALIIAEVTKGDDTTTVDNGQPGGIPTLSKFFKDNQATFDAALPGLVATATATATGAAAAAQGFRNEGEVFKNTATTQAGLAGIARDEAEDARDAAKGFRDDIADLAGLAKPPYETYAAASADLANIPANGAVMVLSDETRNGERTYYKKTGGVLVFSGYVGPVSAATTAALATLSGLRDGALVQTAAAISAFDGGGDLWRMIAGSVEPTGFQVVAVPGGRLKRVRETYDLLKLGLVVGSLAAAQTNRSLWIAIMAEIVARGVPATIKFPKGRTYLGIVGTGAGRVLAVANGVRDLIIEGQGEGQTILTWDTSFDWVASQPDAHIFTCIGAEDITFQDLTIDNQIYEVVYPRLTTTLAADATTSSTSLQVTDVSKFLTAAGQFVANRQFVLTLNAGQSQGRIRKVITSITGNQLNFSGTLGFNASAGNSIQLYLQEQMHGIYMGTQSVYSLPAGVARRITVRRVELCGIRGDGTYALGSDATFDSQYSDILIEDVYIHHNDRSGTAWQRGGRNITIKPRRMHDISDSHIDTEITGGTAALNGFKVIGGYYGACGSYGFAIGSNQSAVSSTAVEILGVDCREANAFQLTNINGLVVRGNVATALQTYAPLTLLLRINNAHFSANRWIGSDDDLNVGYLQDNQSGDTSSNIVFQGDVFDGSASTTPHNNAVFRCGQSVVNFDMSACLFIGSGGSAQPAVHFVSIAGSAPGIYRNVAVSDCNASACAYGVRLSTNLGTGVPIENVTVRGVKSVGALYALSLDNSVGGGGNFPFPNLWVEGCLAGSSGGILNQTGSRQTYLITGGHDTQRAEYMLLVGSAPEGVIPASVGATCVVISPANGAVFWVKRTGANTTTGWRVVGGLRGSATYNPPSLAAGASTTTTVTVPGAVIGDGATAAFSLARTGVRIADVEVTAADTVTVTLTNTTGATVDLAQGTLYAIVTQTN